MEDKGKSSKLSDDIKEQIKKIAGEAFKKAGIASREAAFDDKKFNLATEIAYKLLPLPVRVLVKKDSFKGLMLDIRDQMFRSHEVEKGKSDRDKIPDTAKVKELLRKEGDMSKSVVGSEVETLLRTAASYIDDVEKKTEEFKETAKAIRERTDSAVDSGGFFQAMGASLKERYTISKEKGKILKDLDLAENELKAAEQKDPNAQLEREEGMFSIPMLKSAIYSQRGFIHVWSGELKKAERYFKESFKYFEIPDTYYYLALTLEDLKEPGEACKMYQKCIDIEPNSELVITARKDLQRLESKKIGSGWFVGSWKVFLILAGIAVIGLLGAIFGGDINLLPGTIIFGALASGYWWRKWRKGGLC